MRRFDDRHHAGQALAARLVEYAGRPDALVLALPRGGVPVGYEVARSLDLPLDVFVVLKLGVPGNPELAMGAIAERGVCVLNEEVVKALGISNEEVFAAARAEYAELGRRQHAYRGGREASDVTNRTAILIDDGLATGASMRAAVRALRQRRPARVVAAVPVASSEACAQLSAETDEVICGVIPKGFGAVGRWYEDFAPTRDDEVRDLLQAARHEQEGRLRDLRPARAGNRGAP